MNYRNNRFCENLNITHFDVEGAFDIPVLRPEECLQTEFMGFNFAKSHKSDKDKGVHFFIDDYQFERVWRCPEQYTELLSAFKCVMTPDFSLYTDYPKVIQIYNHYRKHWLGAYWQEKGITVIPTISWSDKTSFEWCFDGESKGSTVAVSSVGTQHNKCSRKMFLEGYKEMLTRLQPSNVLFYGNIPDECEGNIIKLTAYQDRFRTKAGAR